MAGRCRSRAMAYVPGDLMRSPSLLKAVILASAIAAQAAIAAPAPAPGEQPSPPLPSTANLLRLICVPSDIRNGECAKARDYPKTGSSAPCNVRPFERKISGNFLLSGRATLIVGYTSDCEPRANNFGGSMLFEAENGRWIFRNYLRGLVVSQCITLPDRFRRLYCLAGFTNQGHTETVIVAVALSQVRNGTVTAKTENYAVATSSEGAYGAEKVDCKETLHLIGLDRLRAGAAGDTLTVTAEFADADLIRQACAPGAKRPEEASSDAGPGFGYLTVTKKTNFVLDLATKRFVPQAEFKR
jgi:hypothetical protein